MRYQKFIIEKYKAITDPIEINLHKNSLIPIIGVNECGKTTILNGIFAFDNNNDSYNDIIRHITDVNNLYETDISPARVKAVIEIDMGEFEGVVYEYLKEHSKVNPDFKQRKRKYKVDKNFRNTKEITLTRVFTSKEESKYELEPKGIIRNIPGESEFCEKLLLELPYILYFDDFRDSFPDKIEISDKNSSHWLEVIQELFERTSDSYSIFELPNYEKRRRNNILADVQQKLNDKLTKEWANFKLDNRDALEIKIDFDTDEVSKKHFLSFEVIEKNQEGKERNFYVRDRSKGFYWFFNFVMKLEFNPKVVDDTKNTIYLLDEPGSYLHPFAQNKLCKKLLDLSNENKVIYCTHTHYLLDPGIIPLNTIHISSKTSFGRIKLDKCNNYPRYSEGLQTAFQPIFDALYLKPFSLDFAYKKMLLVEGIYDYYAFSMFNNRADFGIMPGKNADSLIGNISIMLGFGIDFLVLWDNDGEGRGKLQEAVNYFGTELAGKHFILLPVEKSSGNRILQNLFDGNDMTIIRRELAINLNSSFEKTISSLFYSKRAREIISILSEKTKNNFQKVFELLKF